MPILPYIASFLGPLLLTVFAASSPLLLGDGSGTINQLSPLVVSGGQVRLASTTADFRVPSLPSEDCIGTDANGVLQTGVCGSGSGSSSGGLGTTTPWTPGQLVAVYSNASTTGVSTTSITATAPLSLSQPISVIGDSASVLSISTAGDWTGTLDGFDGFGYPFPSNATTTRLTFSDGVAVDTGDAYYFQGAGDDNWRAYVNTDNTLFLQISGAPGDTPGGDPERSICLGSNDGEKCFLHLDPYNASSTIKGRLSTQNASTSNLTIGGFLSFAGTLGTAWSDFCTAITGGAGLCDGTDTDTTYTAGDGLTLTGTDIDFDGGATPNGDLGGTWDAITVDDDSHAHTGATLSGIDISDDTNLAGDTEIVLTGDALSIASTIARDTELHAAVTLTGEDYLSLSTQQITANAIDPDNLASADFGAFTCNGTNCSLDDTYENVLTFSYPLVRSANAISLAFGTTTANNWNAHNTFTSLFATNATTTNATTTASQYITSLATAAGAFLAIDPDGKVIATTSPAAGGSGTVSTGSPGQFAFYSAQGTTIAGSNNAYASSTNYATLFGVGAGGNNATTSATIASTTAIGYGALNALTTGTRNVAIGTRAGASLVNTGYNTLIGDSAMSILVNFDASLNTAIGAKAGMDQQSGLGNIVIGGNIGLPDTTGSGQLNIGGLIFGTGAQSSLTTFKSYPNQNSKIGIGTTTPYAKLSVHANSTDTIPTLFAVASSTAAATTTLFSISNTGTITTSLASGLVVSSSGVLGPYAGASCTNQFPRSTNASGAWTCATVANTDLANSTVSYGGVTLSLGGTDATPAFDLADATNINGENIQDDTIDDDSLDFADITLADLTFDVGSVDTTEFGYLNGVTSAIQTQLAALGAIAGQVWSGVHDFGGATSLELPNAANPTVSTAGQIAIDTTAASSSIRYHDGTAERAIYATNERSWVVSSSSLAYYGSYGASGTTTTLLANHIRAKTLNNFYCKTDTGTAWLTFTDGSNDTDFIKCTLGGSWATTTSSNNTWTMHEDFKASIGRQVGSPNIISITWRETPLD